ncbi:MAG: serine/threonine protein kinase, partial [Anaerolineae bacterium]|nr:serine/threonine protein kinase [Anaerolineae bacterium]
MSENFLGQTLGKRYRFEELIGVGSFAHVYRITDLNRRAVLAAKVLRREIAQEPTFLARFQREATVLARLQHPNIVRYYDIVELADDNAMFILMDYIPGTTLESVLQGPITPANSLTYLTPLAAALHFAHSEGVIHRDLKPANILLHENGTLYVTDFGIARLLNVTSDLTLGITIGTPYYMAPEQITGDKPITVATDIYALGIILYRMYTGYLPFRGDHPGIEGDSTATRTTREQVYVKPEPLRKFKPDIDLAIEEIVLRCLTKDPARRYASVSDLYDDLTEAVGAPPISLDTASQEIVTIDPSARPHDSAPAAVPAPPDMKLPEWSQFVPRVDSALDATNNDTSDDLWDEEETLPPVSESPAQKLTSAPAAHTAQTPDRIEHPVPQPVTKPHLEDQLHPPDHVAPPIASPPKQATTPISSADRTLPRLGRILHRD